MSINMTKGQVVRLRKDNSVLSKIVVVFGRNYNSCEIVFDLSAFLMTDQEKVSCQDDFVFYGNLSNSSRSVVHAGDVWDLFGTDDELIYIDLSIVPLHIKKIVFSVTIYDAEIRHQNFGQESNLHIRIYEQKSEEEILRYNLVDDLSYATAVILGELYRCGEEWEFCAVGSGYQCGLAAICQSFGIDVE